MQNYWCDVTGARFAPRVANLFMARWEEDVVFCDHPPQLSCYKRYIDDLVMIWEGDMPSLESFMDKLNNNTKNFKLSWTIDKQQITFLDLEIFEKDNCFHTTLNSGHHQMWLCNIPRGQFIRLRRNYSSEE